MFRRRCQALLWWFPLFSVGISASANEVSPAKIENGIHVHRVRSEMQSAPTQIRVLLPNSLEDGKRYSVIFVLPVEAGTQNRYGDGLLGVKKLNLHNKHRTIFVAPTFADLPWYADHPTNPAIRQETYFLGVVVPFVIKTYPVKDSSNQHLLGFSKSGWGAFSLLLRHPKAFGKAVAWDAPFMMDKPGRYGSGPIFGTAANFEKYQLTHLTKHPPKDTKHPRLLILGQGNFQSQHDAFHAHLEANKFPHLYREGVKRRHHWSSGWVAEAVRMLLAQP